MFAIFVWSPVFVPDRFDAARVPDIVVLPFLSTFTALLLAPEPVPFPILNRVSVVTQVVALPASFVQY